jgi:nudix-type nucleoside diphosphatase (YffH/AdpP family)
MNKDSATVCFRETQTLARSKGTLTSVRFEQLRRDGRWQGRTREIYDNGNSAVVLPYDATRKTVLLTRQLRLPIYLQDGSERSIEACAGKLDGESAERRIIEEIEEELGYRVAKADRLFELYASPAAITEKITYFTCSYSPSDKVSDGGGLPDEGEDIEVIEATLSEAAAMVADGTIVDAKTVILIQCLKERVRAQAIVED